MLALIENTENLVVSRYEEKNLTAIRMTILNGGPEDPSPIAALGIRAFLQAEGTLPAFPGAEDTLPGQYYIQAEIYPREGDPVGTAFIFGPQSPFYIDETIAYNTAPEDPHWTLLQKGGLPPKGGGLIIGHATVTDDNKPSDIGTMLDALQNTPIPGQGGSLLQATTYQAAKSVLPFLTKEILAYPPLVQNRAIRTALAENEIIAQPVLPNSPTSLLHYNLGGMGLNNC